MIVVLDTNIVLRAAFRRSQDPDNLLARARRREFETATSKATVRELVTTLNYERLQRRLDWDDLELETFVANYVDTSSEVEPTFTLNVVRDRPDNRFLEIAVEVGAFCIVSSDGDLLDLGEYQGVRIVTEAEFLAILREAS